MAKIPVYIETVAFKEIGMVEANSVEEYRQKAIALWESIECSGPLNCELDGVEISELGWDLSFDDDLVEDFLAPMIRWDGTPIIEGN